MNVNEVISNRAIQLVGANWAPRAGAPQRRRQHGQSSNDTFPHRDAHRGRNAIEEHLVPALVRLHDATAQKSPSGPTCQDRRTHLEDATPLTVGQEWSGYAAQLETPADTSPPHGRLYRLAMGGTAVAPASTPRPASATAPRRPSPS